MALSGSQITHLAPQGHPGRTVTFSAKTEEVAVAKGAQLNGRFVNASLNGRFVNASLNGRFVNASLNGRFF